jgi:UDP-N-acetylmuramoyl-L-alanyl-D-glutamate--2,6-diaminopimelate ligase
LISVSNLDLSSGRAKFIVKINQEFMGFDKIVKTQEFPIELSVPGYHSVYNGMAAIAIGLIFGIEVEVIQRALFSFKGVERRFEFIYEEDFKIIDDHFANSGNIDVTLGTLDFMDYNKLRMVYAIRGGRGPVVNRENAETILKWAPKIGIDNIIATFSRSHVDEKDVVTDEEIAVFIDTMANTGIKIEIFEELPDAISLALSRAQEGDLILLAGCQGMDFGAKIVLEQLHELRPEFDVEVLYAPLKSRVAGV